MPCASMLQLSSQSLHNEQSTLAWPNTGGHASYSNLTPTKETRWCKVWFKQCIYKEMASSKQKMTLKRLVDLHVPMLERKIRDCKRLVHSSSMMPKSCKSVWGPTRSQNLDWFDQELLLLRAVRLGFICLEPKLAFHSALGRSEKVLLQRQQKQCNDPPTYFHGNHG